MVDDWFGSSQSMNGLNRHIWISQPIHFGPEMIFNVGTTDVPIIIIVCMTLPIDFSFKSNYLFFIFFPKEWKKRKVTRVPKSVSTSFSNQIKNWSNWSKISFPLIRKTILQGTLYGINIIEPKIIIMKLISEVSW